MLEPTEIASLKLYRRAADYLGAAQIYLKSNVLLEEPLQPAHIKERLLGHWGTVPGINLIYAHLNRLVQRTRASVLLITGPGHGAPANLANLYLEGTLAEFYPELSRDRVGLDRLVRSFSWPGGFPSHLNPAIPGVIHEGGELGYALAKGFGAALDNPDLLVAVIVGDGEAETGPTATAWHGTKYLDPQTSGAVLPILHANGYKISSKTIFGAMSDGELDLLFRGYGWQPRIIPGNAGEELDGAFAQALDWAHSEIRALQEEARCLPAGRPRERPAWPMLVLRSVKGMGAPAEWQGKPLAGTWRAHQVPITDPRTDPEALKAVEGWLKSYRPEELFDKNGRPVAEILARCPEGDLRLGMNPHGNGGNLRCDLDLPEVATYEVQISGRGRDYAGAIAPVGAYLRDLFHATEKARNFRLVCPDETTSNKLEAVFQATDRAFVWPTEQKDEHLSPGGRVMEMLSEHMCQGWLEGYLLTGRHGIFPCYEAFIAIVDGMVNQHSKFLKQSREVPWRKPISSLNYLLTSDGWRQDHNGYSHQGPGFINMLLNKKGSVFRIYLPPDANTLLTTIHHCLKTRDYVNLIVATKNEMPQWLTLAEAIDHRRAGASVWRWASTHEGEDPDVVLAAAGNTPTLETLAAAALLRRDVPELRVRVVNVLDLLVLDTPREHPHGMNDDNFARLFPRDKDVIFAFHGYPSAVRQLLFSRPDPHRFHVFGYQEEGTTTTPFDMTVRNGISRYHLAIEALRRAPRLASMAGEKIDLYERALREHRVFIETYGNDPEEIRTWKWPG
jgi:xylulose-5-phosphate/fructose-6-phosphate phosphoketolase